VIKLRVWHPHLRAPANQLILTVPAGGPATIPVSVKLRRPAPIEHDY
jgi:hypothetical protein